jgi:ketosteroid isomerase-like protein
MSMNSPATDALEPLPTSEVVLSWARDLYFEHVDRKDARAFAAAFLDDATLRFANAPVIRGRASIETAIAEFFTTFIDLRHEPRNSWLVGDTLILEATVTYTRHDRRQVTIPAVTIFHLAGALPGEPSRPVADDCRIYVDLTPLYASADPDEAA